MNENDPLEGATPTDPSLSEAHAQTDESAQPPDAGADDVNRGGDTAFSGAEPEAETAGAEPEAMSDAAASPAGASDDRLAAAAISDDLRARTAEEHARHVERIVPTCCRFRLGGQDYFLRIEYMMEIADFLDVTVIPLAPPHIRGLVNLRGDAIPVIDLARLRGVALAPSPDYRLIITDAGGERLAFIVEGIPVLSREMEGEEVDVVQFVQNFRVGVS